MSMIHARQQAFALPTILITSVSMMIILLASLTAVSSISAAIRDQYFNKQARTAAESGIAMAKACLKQNDGLITWTDESPLRPGGTCNGLASQCTNQNCYVTSSSSSRGTFSVGLPQSSSNTHTIRSTARLDQLRTSNSSLIRSYANVGVEVYRYRSTDINEPPAGTFDECNDPASTGYTQVNGQGMTSISSTSGTNNRIYFNLQTVTNLRHGGSGAAIVCGESNTQGISMDIGGSGSKKILGGSGNDAIQVSGIVTVSAGPGDDTITGSMSGGNGIYAGEGNDTVNLTGGNSLAYGGSGNDSITLSGGGATGYGGSGDDTLNVSGANAKAYGDSGNDIVNVGGSNVEGYGGSGNDTMRITSGSGTLWGGRGNDRLEGNSSNDTLYGDEGNDMLYGMAGNDILYGGSGTDYLDGGAHPTNGGDRGIDPDPDTTYVNIEFYS